MLKMIKRRSHYRAPEIKEDFSEEELCTSTLMLDYRPYLNTFGDLKD